MIMRNRANNAQARVPQIKKPRSIFPIQKSRKQTMKASYLIPIFFEEVIPGDTWNVNMTAFIRMLPQVAPPMDNLVCSTFFFYDPCRLEWENFTKQHGERKNPNDSIDYITPTISCPDGGFKAKSLQDYLGKPIGVDIKTTAFGERMYNRIYNQYFRASQLMDSIYENDTDQDDVYTNYELKKITKMHDYFTDALPTLAGPEDPITLPLGTRAFVKNIDYNEAIPQSQLAGKGLQRVHYYTQVVPSEGETYYERGDGVNTLIGQDANGAGTANFITNDTGARTSVQGSNKSRIYTAQYVDLSEATGATVQALRFALQTQALLERDNVTGSRYTELMEMRYGCINPDLQLYRCQYLGGTKTPIFTTPVLQTSGTTQTSPQGNMAGYSVTTDGGNVIKASFGEFGHIMGLMAITAVPQYQYGCHRKFTRMQRYDYMYPEFQNISDQNIKNKELFAQDDTIVGADGETPVNEETWGYIPRYDEYRYFNNEVCGELRSNYDQSLDVWTYAENMENLQNLSGEFLEDKTDEIVQRSMAVQTDQEGEIEDQFLLDALFTGTVTRGLVSKPIPTTGGRLL